MADALWSQVATVTNFAYVGGTILDGKGWTWSRRNGAAIVSPGDLDLSGNTETGAKCGRSVDAGLMPLLAIGTGDFSLEIEFQAAVGDQPSFFSGLYCTDVWGLSLRNFGQEIEFEGNSVNLDVRDGATTLIHLGRSGGQMYFHRNGDLVGSAFVPSNFGAAPTVMTIGALSDETSGFAGRILKARATIGVCRYTANYTPTAGDFDTNGQGPGPVYTTATATPAAGSSAVSAATSTTSRVTGLAAGRSTVQGQGQVFGDSPQEITEEDVFLMMLTAMQTAAEEDTGNGSTTAVPAAGAASVSGVGRTLGNATAGATAARGVSTTSAVGRSLAVTAPTSPIAGISEARALTNSQSTQGRAVPAEGRSIVSATTAYFTAARARTDGFATVSGVGGITGLIITTATPAAGSAFVKGVGKGSPGGRGGDDGPGRPRPHKPPKHRGIARGADNRKRDLAEPDLEESLRPGLRAERERQAELARQAALAALPQPKPPPDPREVARQAALNNVRLLELEIQQQALRDAEAERVAQQEAAEREARRQWLAEQRKQLNLLLLLMADG